MIGSGATGLDKLVWGEETKRLLNGHCMQLNWALYFLKIKIWNSKLLQNCWNLSRFSDVFKQHKNLQSKKNLLMPITQSTPVIFLLSQNRAQL